MKSSFWRVARALLGLARTGRVAVKLSGHQSDRRMLFWDTPRRWLAF